MPNPNFIFLCMRRGRMLERGGDERGGEVIGLLKLWGL